MKIISIKKYQSFFAFKFWGFWESIREIWERLIYHFLESHSILGFKSVNSWDTFLFSVSLKRVGITSWAWGSWSWLSWLSLLFACNGSSAALCRLEILANKACQVVLDVLVEQAIQESTAWCGVCRIHTSGQSEEASSTLTANGTCTIVAIEVTSSVLLLWVVLLDLLKHALEFGLTLVKVFGLMAFKFFFSLFNGESHLLYELFSYSVNNGGTLYSSTV